ncbi:MAG: chemotaxis protein CheX [Thermoguttaceae bacterium]
MKVEYINPFLTSTISVFSTMLGTTLVREEPYLKDNSQPNFDVSGIIGLSGKAKGMVVLTLDRQTALQAAHAMTGEEHKDINADVADAVGELTNMIAGSAKAKLEHLSLSVSLPSVITGKAHCVEFPKNTKPICIPFDCEWGAVAVEVGIVE